MATCGTVSFVGFFHDFGEVHYDDFAIPDSFALVDQLMLGNSDKLGCGLLLVVCRVLLLLVLDVVVHIVAFLGVRVTCNSLVQCLDCLPLPPPSDVCSVAALL